MECDDFKNLKTLIEALTHSGSSALDEDVFKKVKKICKSSQKNISHVFSLCSSQLEKNNSQIRLSTLQIFRELFKRSGLFREYVLKDLQKIFELTAEINSKKKLPPPKTAAENLKSLAVLTLKEWVQEFGETYRKLKVTYNYLEKCRKVDFQSLRIENSSEQIVESEHQRHVRVVNEEKLKKIVEEFNSNKTEIEMTITSLSNCLCLLLPPAEEFFIPEHSLQKPDVIQNNINTCDAKSTYSSKTCNISNSKQLEIQKGNEIESLDNSYNLRAFGVTLDYKLTLDLNIGEKFTVNKTEENSSVFENAKDCVTLICNRFLPMVKKWIKIYSKCSNELNNELKEILDLKEKLENVLKKHNSIIVNDASGISVDANSSDDDFEEVKKEGYEESVDFPEELECLRNKSDFAGSNTATETLKHIVKETKSNSSEPGTSGELSSTSQILDRKKRLLSIAPKLPYDIDLYHWEDENLTTPVLISSKIDVDKFWGSVESDNIHIIPNPDGVAALRTRVIEYSGTFEPVKWACRAPLPNGKLCPRKDRYKCPFHGKIVARDEMGNIQNQNNQNTFKQAIKGSSTATVPELQDLEFLNDLQAATGADLKILNKKRKNTGPNKNLTHKKMKTSAAALKLLDTKKLPGLVDVVRKQNNCYARLKKKIFNRSSLKRVSSVLNKLDKNKFKDKYGDQFNYL